MTPHTCHARGCKTRTPREMLMCARHWRLVIDVLRMNVWHHYHRGQEIDGRPSPEWHHAADRAIAWVAIREAGENRCDHCGTHIYQDHDGPCCECGRVWLPPKSLYDVLRPVAAEVQEQ